MISSGKPFEWIKHPSLALGKYDTECKFKTMYKRWNTGPGEAVPYFSSKYFPISAKFGKIRKRCNKRETAMNQNFISFWS